MLVTGARGMLGTDLCCRLRAEDWEVIAADVTEFDIADPVAAGEFVGRAAPAAIVNCAAYTAVDRAETDPGTAFRVNRDGARVLAAAAGAVGASLLHMSTDYVFDGAKPGPYEEGDAPRPLGVYGASKLAGEEAVRETLLEHWIIRTAWLYGPSGGSFPRTILRMAADRKPLRIVADQVGCPTYTEHLAAVLTAVLRQPYYGTYHAVSEGTCTWYELARAVLAAAGQEADVTPITTREYPLPARRPANSVLDTSKLARVYGCRLPHWKEGVARFAAAWREGRVG